MPPLNRSLLTEVRARQGWALGVDLAGEAMAVEDRICQKTRRYAISDRVYSLNPRFSEP